MKINRMHIGKFIYMASSEVLRFLYEVSNPEFRSTTAVIAAATLLNATFCTPDVPLYPGKRSRLLVPALSPGCQKSNPFARNKYSRTHLWQRENLR